MPAFIFSSKISLSHLSKPFPINLFLKEDDSFYFYFISFSFYFILLPGRKSGVLQYELAWCATVNNLNGKVEKIKKTKSGSGYTNSKIPYVGMVC